MGVGTQDMFGDANTAQPAVAGSYGQAPRGYRLPAGTRLGAVHLQIGDLTRSLRFYTETLGLRVLDRHPRRATLAAHGDDRILVELYEEPGTRAVGRRGLLGLYHYAILLPDRPSLGRFVKHLADTGTYAGSGDHLVSEAFYLTDPDGLGIEVYADRPRDTWQRLGRELMIATDPVDVPDLIRAAGTVPWTGMPAGTVIGHVHLHVGDLNSGAEFFSEALGFDRMTWRYPGALFLGADGYHHHLGTNTWAGSGARPPASDEAQLREWTIELPTTTDVAATRESLIRGGHPAESIADGSFGTRDPFGTRVRVVAGARFPSHQEQT
jgi:catechol 2,3-dioxygenase